MSLARGILRVGIIAVVILWIVSPSCMSSASIFLERERLNYSPLCRAPVVARAHIHPPQVRALRA